MNVLITGAYGFIGRRVTAALLARGYRVIGCARHSAPFNALFPGQPFVPADFSRDHRPADWISRLTGVDAVINTVGIFREKAPETFDAVHVRAPVALFNACAQAGVRRVLQLSALGAEADARTPYHRSKKAADDSLMTLDLEWVVVQPSLVYGPNGTSARLFNAVASLPVIPLPGSHNPLLQPMHVDDVVDAIAALLQLGAPVCRRIPLVGPEPLPLRDYIAALRSGMHLPSPRYAYIPLSLVQFGAWVGGRFPRGLLTPDALAMLLRGSVGNVDEVATLLKRSPRHPRDFIGYDEADNVRTAAYLFWLLPVLRWSIALVWLVSGVVSLGIYPVSDSYAMLARVGVEGFVAPILLYGAATVDLAIGLAILALRRRRWLWIVQIVLITGYSLVIAWALPEFWLHPFAPLVKNVPVLAGILLLLALEE